MERKKVVAAARLNAQKNYPMMLRAFKLFLGTHKDYVLHIYGDGDKRDSLIDLAKTLNISDSVVFEGNVPDLHERIKSARMFVLSSDYEGILNSLLEALAMGLPSISTDCPCGGSRLLIEDGVSGFLTPINDEVVFSNAMKKIAESTDLAISLLQKAISVRILYSEEKIIGKYFDYMSTVKRNFD